MIPFLQENPMGSVPNGDRQEPVKQAAPGSRDTDRDWQIIGEQDPFFGVLTDRAITARILTDDARADFFRSGKASCRAARPHPAVFGAFDPRSALDFGCGVGRLTQPLAPLCGDAVWVDVSAGMRAEAQNYNRTGAVFTDRIPPRAFDWSCRSLCFSTSRPSKTTG